MLQTIFVIFLLFLGYIFYVSDKEDKKFTQTLDEFVETAQGKRGIGCYAPGSATLIASDAVEKHISGKVKISEISIIKSGMIITGEPKSSNDDTEFCGILYRYLDEIYMCVYTTLPTHDKSIGGGYFIIKNKEYDSSNPSDKEFVNSIKE